jgi:hypothetical protein
VESLIAAVLFGLISLAAFYASKSEFWVELLTRKFESAVITKGIFVLVSVFSGIFSLFGIIGTVIELAHWLGL